MARVYSAGGSVSGRTVQTNPSANGAASGSHHHGLLRYFFALGLTGLFFISTIDSSPIPLPIPGSSDLLVVLLAAQRGGWLMVTAIATLGSIVGAAISYQTGVAGGLAIVDRYVPRRFAERMRKWSETHSLLSVALPAILPPPAPLMPFLIAAGALRMPRWRFFWSFTISRFVRHAFFAWLGYHYGRSIVAIYNRFADRFGWIVLLVVWGSVVFAIIYAIVQWRRSKNTRRRAGPGNAELLELPAQQS